MLYIRRLHYIHIFGFKLLYIILYVHYLHLSPRTYAQQLLQDNSTITKP
jgi:hypothetical protein